MTLIVILNSVLAILIVSAIVALHTQAIFGDRRTRRRGAILLTSAEKPLSPAPSTRPRVAAGPGEERREKIAA